MLYDRQIFMKPVDSWIVVTFYTVIVKVDSLRQKCNGDILTFFKESECGWDMNGSLCSTAAMDFDDLDSVITLLRARGLQCETAPVDFYVLRSLCRTPGCNSGVSWGTFDDGELEFRYDGWEPCARLRDPEKEGGPAILGAIAGDIIGSVYEQHNIKRTDFTLFSPRCRFTDDTVLTVAIADAILTGTDYGSKLKEWYNLYPDRGYGPGFRRWAAAPDMRQRSSMGNGSAMRACPVGFYFDTLDEVLDEARKSAEPSHNHKEGIKGAQAVAASVFLARKGCSKYYIKYYISSTFSYDLDRTVDEIRPTYKFDVSCQGSVPEAIIAFLESTDYESAIRLAVSLGGDSDTIACIAGGIAYAFYKTIPTEIAELALKMLSGRLKEVVQNFVKHHGVLV